MLPFGEGSSLVLEISVCVVCELVSSLPLEVVGAVVEYDSDYGQ